MKRINFFNTQTEDFSDLERRARQSLKELATREEQMKWLNGSFEPEGAGMTKLAEAVHNKFHQSRLDDLERDLIGFKKPVIDLNFPATQPVENVPFTIEILMDAVEKLKNLTPPEKMSVVFNEEEWSRFHIDDQRMMREYYNVGIVNQIGGIINVKDI